METSLIEIEKNYGLKLKKYLDEGLEGHEDFQLEYFIVQANGLTPWGAYKQCVREISSRWEGLKNLQFEIDKAVANIAIFEHRRNKMLELNTEESKLKATLYDIQTRKHKLNRDTNIRQLNRGIRELLWFLDRIPEFEKQIEGKDRAKLIKEDWIAKIRQSILMHTVWGGAGFDVTLETISNMPEDVRDKLFLEAGQMKFKSMVEEYARQMDAHKTALIETNTPPALPPPNGNGKKLLSEG